ncbi:hypothetical protein E1A91_D01G080100v1 [Gossypium mustelinum]|uniref:Acyl carrier protein n=1 Tax=Gossypium mustelinum TaxID=34275 RepID=A0A5D2W421_GOSMU|nr:hypothetical protein E1A91_D01G080100v1 [Gossypium mustelinum]
MAAVREALLKRLRVNATSLSLLRNPKPSLNGLFALTFNAVHRRFSDDVMGSFLDKSEVTDRVVSVVKNFQKVDPSKGFWIVISLYPCPIMLGNRGSNVPLVAFTPNAHFQNDLGLDSLDTVEVVMALEEEFGFEIPDNEADKIGTINHAVEFIASHPQAK